MSQKRQPEDGKARWEGDLPEDKRRRFRSVVQEVMRLQTLKRMMEPVLEPLIRKVVKEEVESALTKHLTGRKWIWEKEMLPLESRSLQLKFLTSLSLPMFTSARIEGDDGQDIRIGLTEPLTGQIVSSGPESSAKLEVVVLEGDFDSDGNWTAEDFKNNIVREREGKKPLLNGDVFLVLNDGIGVMGEISFTDNSSWTRSRKFRLGARMLDQFNCVKVREATTESFVVRDHRGELYRKHHPPSLLDEVWRLEKIGKDGAFHKRLNLANINTVKDFLTFYHLNPSRLRQILGTGMSTKMWEVTVEHAQSCVLNNTVHLYYPPGYQKKSGVVFNVVAQVMGLFKECQYVPAEKLSETERAEAKEMVVAALNKRDEVISYQDGISLIEGFLHNNALFMSTAAGMLASGAMNVPSYPVIGGFDDFGPSVTGLNDCSLLNLEKADPFRYCQASACDMEAMPQALSEDYHLRFLNSDTPQCSQILGLEESPADLQSALDGFMSQRHITAAGAVDKAQRRWKKLFSVLKWLSVQKFVRLKKTRL